MCAYTQIATPLDVALFEQNHELTFHAFFTAAQRNSLDTGWQWGPGTVAVTSAGRD